MLWKDEQLPTMLPLSSSLLPAHGAGKWDWPCSASPAGYCLHGFMPAVLLSDLEQTLCLYPKTSVPTTALSFSVDFFSFFLKMEKQEFRILQNAPFFFFYTIKRLHFGNFSPKYFPVFPTYVPQPLHRPVKPPGSGPWPQPTQPACGLQAKVTLLIFSLSYAWCPNCLVRQFFIVIIISTHAVSKHFHVSDCRCQAPWSGRGSSCFGAVGPALCNFTTSCCAALSCIPPFFSPSSPCCL